MEYPYSEITRSVEISVKPAFEENYSVVCQDFLMPDSVNEFVYSYTIKITNLGSGTVQLIDRHWLIYSNGKLTAEVQGDGVVGVQPVLRCGTSHVYQSNVVIPQPEGFMEGSYRFVDENNESFLVKIPKFDLIYPGLFH